MLWDGPPLSSKAKLFQKATSKAGVQSSPATQAAGLTKVLRKTSPIAVKCSLMALSRSYRREDNAPNMNAGHSLPSIFLKPRYCFT